MDYRPPLSPIIICDIQNDFLLSHLYSLTWNYQEKINWMREYGLLAHGMQCKCGAEMYEGSYVNSYDGYKWKCRVYKSSCSIPLVSSILLNSRLQHFSNSSISGAKTFSHMLSWRSN